SVRPTSDRAKETLFNIFGDRVRGGVFLDLFSGSGSIGLEAASRGASEVVLVEKDPATFALLCENLARCGLDDRVTALRLDGAESLDLFREQGRSFDVIFLDPPYRDPEAYGLISLLDREGLLAAEGVLVAEHDRRRLLPEQEGSLVRVRQKRVGDTIFSFYRKAGK
ncbi:MAG: 16S rRNA (guanine(966)-N(2))-methyltransferase RsmD, partial [Deltaproteobacteria bacterium]|nr:16S rRNA (guanine(966)-N(2))-methyltransferase RsmD [Deltaproteobacteria bacterium]